jgi:hypothetical protein
VRVGHRKETFKFQNPVTACVCPNQTNQRVDFLKKKNKKQKNQKNDVEPVPLTLALINLWLF